MSRGERSLEVLLRTMNPRLHEGEFVFVQMKDIPPDAVAAFREEEGLTVVIERSRAEATSLPYSYVAAWITLTVHSDLAAVGFLAAVTAPLAAAGISCNVFSAFLHDHLFVPYDRRHEAMRILSAAPSAVS